MTDWILALDTSAYTTSLATVDLNGHLLSDKRVLLQVPTGERGLRQSEAFYSHVKQVPDLFASISRPEKPPVGIAVSSRPRPLEGSFMPVFLVGTQFARVLSLAWGCPLWEFSHQEGHVMAGLHSAEGPCSEEFIAVHISGGTTEILRVRRNRTGFLEQLLGGTNDLHAGQLVDRIGVALGLPFPSGPHLEALAIQSAPQGEYELRIPSYCRNMAVSFSGAEAAALRMITRGEPGAEIARALERCIAVSISKMILQAIESTGLRDVLLVGGVAANLYINGEIRRRVATKGDLFFASREFSSDNAAGLAWLALAAFAASFDKQEEPWNVRR